MTGCRSTGTRAPVRWWVYRVLRPVGWCRRGIEAAPVGKRFAVRQGRLRQSVDRSRPAVLGPPPASPVGPKLRDRGGPLSLGTVQWSLPSRSRTRVVDIPACVLPSPHGGGKDTQDQSSISRTHHCGCASRTSVSAGTVDARGTGPVTKTVSPLSLGVSDPCPSGTLLPPPLPNPPALVTYVRTGSLVQSPVLEARRPHQPHPPRVPGVVGGGVREG